MITIKKDEHKIYYVREGIYESVITDTYTLIVCIILLYLTKNYLGNSFFALQMMFLSFLMIWHKDENSISKKEFLEMLKKEVEEEEENG